MTGSKLQFDQAATDTAGMLSARKQRLIQSGVISEMEFNSIGEGYNLPVADHKYTIVGTGALKFGEFGKKVKSNGYIDQVEKRAKSSVDPRKYASHDDWKK